MSSWSVKNQRHVALDTNSDYDERYKTVMSVMSKITKRKISEFDQAIKKFGNTKL